MTTCVAYANSLSQGHRLAARALGAQSEALAEDWLTARGFDILARQFKVPGGEIDLIAISKDIIIFVEVKARQKLDAALSAISSIKQRRVARAAAHWLAHNPWAGENHVLRGDAVCLGSRCSPVHIEDAFPLDYEG